MLSKLAFRNVKRSIKDYVIYLITIILAFSFMFSFNLLGTSKEVLQLSTTMNNFEVVMYFVNIFIVLSVCFLINYTTKFMFEKRSKEFGTYLLLGIKKKKISRMFLLENIFLGLLALLISIPIGYLFGIFMSFIVTKMFKLNNIVSISLNFKSIILLLIYFILIYFIVLFLARHRIKKVKIYDLLYLEKKNEEKSIKKNKIRNITFLISIIVGIIALYLFAGEFHVGKEPSFLIIFFSIILIFISIFGITITLSDFILNSILKRKNLKYSKDNLFVARTFSSKIKTMSFTTGVLTTLITFALVSLNLSSLFKAMFDYQLETFAPYDISINEIKEGDVSKYEDFIKQKYTIKEQYVYNGYIDNNRDISNALGEHGGWREYDQVIKLSDYNKLLELKDDEPITLSSDEYIVNVTKELNRYLVNNNSIKTITLSNGIKLKQKEVLGTGYSSSWGIGYGFIIVVPDSAIKGLEIGATNMIINTTEKTSEEFAKELTSLLAPDICEETEEGYTVCYSLGTLTVRGQVEAQYNSYITIISFVSFYVAFIFIATVGTILAIQSLSDSAKYKYRYKVLSRLGIKSEELHKTIRKQLLVFFIFPIIYPLIISYITIASLNDLFSIALSSNKAYLIYYFVNILVFLLIYSIYFLATYFGFKRNIDKS